MAISKVASAVVVKRLYRSLLRAAKPYTSPSPNAAVLSCLLYRTGIDDWDSVAKATPQEYARTEDRARDLTESYATRRAGGNSQGENSRESYAAIQHQRLFRSLLREVVAGSNGYRRMLFPSQVDPTRLRDVVRREFRENNDIPTISAPFDDTTRIQVAFVALRELNKKLSHFEFLEQESGTPIPQQAARHVSPLPFTPSSSYLKPGVFLVSHPHLNDSFFSKSVVCILDHKDESTESGSKRSEDAGSTYGVIVNRFSMNPETGKNRTIREAFLKSRLPARLADIFGDAVVKDGGPVHVSIQMLYAAAADNEELSSIGGAVIPMVPEGDSSTALFSDQATYFQGDLFQAMTAVENGKIDRDDISFFVGASRWSPGQLESEIAQGFWIPCRGPPEIARTGICEHELSPGSGDRPLADLWLSMMSACGEDEAKLAHLVYHEEWDENGLPCDAFDGSSH